jgi:hypothetical protein
MFWNKKKKDDRFKEGGIVPHEVIIHELINQKMEVFREQVIKKDDKLIKRVDELESIVKALCPCKDVEITESEVPKKDHESVGIFDTILPAARSEKEALENIKKKSRLLYCSWYWTPYTKTCTLCGKVEYITKKQYLTYQKETIESSLKECE